jgi:hypothetical protein
MQPSFDDHSAALDIQLDPTIVKITDATDQMKPRGSARRKRTKSHSLHTTSHKNTYSNQRWINRFSHLPFSSVFDCNQLLRCCSADILIPHPMRHAFCNFHALITYIITRISNVRVSLPFMTGKTKRILRRISGVF